MTIINAAILTLLILIPIYLIVKLRKLRVSFLINIKYWLILYSYFYILLPSYLLEITNRIQHWEFTNTTIILSKLAGLYFVSIMFFISAVLIQDKKVNVDKEFNVGKVASILLLFIWGAIVIYSLFITYKVSSSLAGISGMDRVMRGDLFEEFNSAYKLKSVLFFCLTISTIKFWERKKVIYFFPLLIIAFNDLMAGGRTFLFFAIIAIYLNFVLKNDKLYLKQIIACLVILVASVTNSRMSVQSVDASMSKSVNFVYQSLGEFIQTFNTFSYSIQHDFISKNPIEGAFINTIQGIFPGFLKVKLGLTGYSPGVLLASEIDRGYGLGFSVITEAFYYGGWILVLLSPIICTVLINKLGDSLLKLKFPGFICFLFLIIYLRLFFREGITSYFLIPIYLFLIYGIISVKWHKFDILKINKKKLEK